jgi:hypothetical protein
MDLMDYEQEPGYHPTKRQFLAHGNLGDMPKAEHFVHQHHIQIQQSCSELPHSSLLHA